MVSQLPGELPGTYGVAMLAEIGLIQLTKTPLFEQGAPHIVDYFVRYMGQDDDIAKALDQGYQSGLNKGREFEAGYLRRQIQELIQIQRVAPMEGHNNAQIIHTMTALEEVEALLSRRLNELEARNARVR